MELDGSKGTDAVDEGEVVLALSLVIERLDDWVGTRGASRPWVLLLWDELVRVRSLLEDVIGSTANRSRGAKVVLGDR